MQPKPDQRSDDLPLALITPIKPNIPTESDFDVMLPMYHQSSVLLQKVLNDLKLDRPKKSTVIKHMHDYEVENEKLLKFEVDNRFTDSSFDAEFDAKNELLYLKSENAVLFRHKIKL